MCLGVQLQAPRSIYLAMVDVLYKKNNACEHEDESFASDTIHEVTANEDWDIDDNAQITWKESMSDNEDCGLELSEKVEKVIYKIHTVNNFL